MDEYLTTTRMNQWIDLKSIDLKPMFRSLNLELIRFCLLWPNRRLLFVTVLLSRNLLFSVNKDFSCVISDKIFVYVLGSFSSLFCTDYFLDGIPMPINCTKRRSKCTTGQTLRKEQSKWDMHSHEWNPWAWISSLFFFGFPFFGNYSPFSARIIWHGNLMLQALDCASLGIFYHLLAIRWKFSFLLFLVQLD